MENSKEEFGAPYYTVHRADLHLALLDKVREAGVIVMENKRVLSYDFEAPSVTVEGGDSFHADVVIACDGEIIIYLLSRLISF